MRPVLFRFDDYVQPGEAFHVVSKALGPERPARPHIHDYYEVFLVAQGRLTHETSAGPALMERGDLCLVRPGDAHALHAEGAEGCRILNVMFGADTAAHLALRYGSELRGRFFWHGDPGPRAVRLTGTSHERAERHMERLRQGPRTLARIERYLLVLTTEILAAEDEFAGVPPWLAAACRAALEPAVFRLGGAGLVASAGRAHEHVCRQVRRHFGMTPTQYVNRIRMEHAAMLLDSSDATLEEIATRCGFEGPGHFHRLFRDRYGATPGSFRRRAGDPVQNGGTAPLDARAC